MSDELTTFVDAEPENIGSTEESDKESSLAPEENYLDLQEYSNFRVPVKLDGEETQVSLSEAIAGYQRQADYTRKTQELSQQRESFQFASALQSALETDPAKTLEMLQDHYGISRQKAEQMVENENLDPSEQKYRELDSRIAQFEDERGLREVEREIASLEEKYGDEFDVAEVVASALKRGTTDLEGTYKQLAYDKIVAQSKLSQDAETRRKTKEESVVNAKREASVISGGSSATGNTTDESGTITTIAEAYAAAKRQHGAD